MFSKIDQNISLNRLLNLSLSFCLLFGSLPLWPFIALAIKKSSPGPIFFCQKRAGLHKKPFTIFKFRTMTQDAERKKKLLLKKNEAHGPVFKIRDDPRYTRIGRWLAHSGLDELPQLLNILKGDMNLVGPRPLPIKEVIQISPKYQPRFQVKPGIFSTWTAQGSQHQNFSQWMQADLADISHRSLKRDLQIIFQTIRISLQNIF